MKEIIRIEAPRVIDILMGEKNAGQIGRGQPDCFRVHDGQRWFWDDLISVLPAGVGEFTRSLLGHVTAIDRDVSSGDKGRRRRSEPYDGSGYFIHGSKPSHGMLIFPRQSLEIS
jgi:hypothetical protein